MGLDITAYSHVKKLAKSCSDEDLEDYEACCKHQHIRARVVPDFADRLPSGAGCYKSTPKTKEHRFPAGSYSYYNAWRTRLSQIILNVPAEIVWHNLEEYANQPFFELIYFSDAEGTMGPAASKRLYETFVEFREMVQKEDEYFRRLYDDMTEAFKLGAQHGLVQFH